jgi:hypothetical protein
MSVPTPEAQPNDQAGQQNSDGHPAWNEILSEIPEELHGLIKPKLEAWDKGVQEKITGLHQEYEPFKELKAQGADVQAIENSLRFAQLFETDPEAVIRNAIQHYQLEEALADMLGVEYEDDEGDDDDYDEDDDDEEEEVPHWAKNLNRRLTAAEQRQLEREQAEEESRMQEVIDQYLEDLHEQFDEEGKPVFNDEFVLTLMASGVDGEEAVKQFYSYLGGNQAGNSTQTSTSDTAPVVAGAGGSVGSGVPVDSKKFGDMERDEIDDYVAQAIAQAIQQGN